MSNTPPLSTATSDGSVSDRDSLPYIQYGFPHDKGPIRAPKLQTIFEPIPANAITASPIYLLTRDQCKRQKALETGYEVHGETLSIATELQDECERDDRVLYPVHIESDQYPQKGPAPLIKWFIGFVEDSLEMSIDECRLYFSGNRSIHVHVPRFVRGEGRRERLKSLATNYCEETSAELDCGIYSRKRLFRLPGVKHRKTELRKVEIESTWNRDQIFREANSATTDHTPESYAEILRYVFLPESPPGETPPTDVFRVLTSGKAMLELSSNEQGIEVPLVEQDSPPEQSSEMPRWTRYNAKEFSPYALATGSSRSVAVVTVKGTPFARRDVTIGNGHRPAYALVPAYFHGAIGCAGRVFTKDNEHAPLQLSKPDYEKWEYSPGDQVVIIGGKSNRSRLFAVNPLQAVTAGDFLTAEGGGRQAALEYLAQEGYDIGSAGASTATTILEPTGTQRPRRPTTDTSARTEAALLQRKAEQNGIQSLSHEERWRIACRLLRQGWDPAWDWFRQQFGDQFKPTVTREQFQSILQTYPDDYDHIDVSDSDHS